MRRRQSTITQQYAPSFRRRVGNNYLSLSLPGAKIIVDNDRQSPKIKQNVDYIKKAELWFSIFVDTHGKIDKIIEMVDEIIRKRMQAHEEGLLSVVKSEIDKMQDDCRRVVQQYNLMIDAKNKETQIYNLKNQVDYFRTEALKLFESNKKLTMENKQLRQLVKNKDSIIQQLNAALKKNTKKLLKQRAIADRKQKTQTFIKNYTQINEQTTYFQKTSHLNIKQEINKIKQSSIGFQLAKPQNQPLFSNRYSNCKSNMSTNIGNKSFKRRLYTEMATTSDNIPKKDKNEAKSKSFWKFETK